MQQHDWASNWTEGRIGFHQSRTNDHLDAFATSVFGADYGRVYVPLCGKSLDMTFLAEHAERVIGVEFVEQAVAEFFDEQGLTPSISTEPHRRYEADRYTLFAADFFDIGPNELGHIDAVFDRASLVALDAPTRQRYAAHLTSLLSAGSTMLLVSFAYDQTEMDGPPFSVTTDEITELYGDGFDIEILGSRESVSDDMRSRGISSFVHTAYKLTRY